MVEQPIRNRQVVGSTPTLGSTIAFHNQHLPHLLNPILPIRCKIGASSEFFQKVNPSRPLVDRSNGGDECGDCGDSLGVGNGNGPAPQSMHGRAPRAPLYGFLANGVQMLEGCGLA